MSFVCRFVGVLAVALTCTACPASDDPAAGDDDPPIDAMPGPEPDMTPDPPPDMAPDPEPDMASDPDPDGAIDPDPDMAIEPDGGIEPDAAPDAAVDAEVPVCGDGRLQDGEGCDDGPANSDERPNACRTDCQPSRCGDGVIDGLEECDGGERCTEECVLTCRDECRQIACVDGAVVPCANTDDDPCLEAGEPMPCGEFERCESGACVEVCRDVCEVDAIECVDPPGVRTCIVGAEGCTEWTEPVLCAPFERCAEAACFLPPPPPVVINEIYTDQPGRDGSETFLELFGPPGTDLTDLVLVSVNGSNGRETVEVEMVGAIIPEDGFFVIAGNRDDPLLEGQVDFLDADSDLQNGPDSLQLRRGDEILDAVGYGDFADAIFAGEGSPAPQAPAGTSISRDAAHTDTDDNLTDFAITPPSPGADPPPPAICVEEETRCVEGRAEVCAAGDEGLDWQLLDDCAARAVACVDGACAERVCEVGARRCAADVVEECALVEGIARWQPVDPCGDQGFECADGACRPPVCGLDERRCVGARVEACDIADGTARWVEVEDCAEANLACADGVCAEPQCPDVCEVDARRCMNERVERCALVDGCPSYVLDDDCRARGERCLVDRCVPDCEDVCEADTQRCFENTVERCEAVDGCFRWVIADDCDARGQVCVEPVCVDPM